MNLLGQPGTHVRPPLLDLTDPGALRRLGQALRTGGLTRAGAGRARAVIEIWVDGSPLPAMDGQSVAAALHRAGVVVLGANPVDRRTTRRVLRDGRVL